MFQVFYLDTAYVAVATVLYTSVAKYVPNVFTCFRRMLQQELHVASVFISRRGKRAQAEAVPANLATDHPLA